MAKKKQLAGKKTKLAKLPLTQVLASQAEEAASGGPPLASPGPWGAPDRALEEPTALAAAYLKLVQELKALRSRLGPDRDLLFSEPAPFTPPLAEPSQIRRVLRLARKGLQDLHRLLSRD
jgi:hypothetical protein